MTASQHTSREQQCQSLDEPSISIPWMPRMPWAAPPTSAPLHLTHSWGNSAAMRCPYCARSVQGAINHNRTMKAAKPEASDVRSAVSGFAEMLTIAQISMPQKIAKEKEVIKMTMPGIHHTVNEDSRWRCSSAVEALPVFQQSRMEGLGANSYRRLAAHWVVLVVMAAPHARAQA
jgi:hypothetical protein